MIKLIPAAAVLYKIIFFICIVIGITTIGRVEYKNWQYKKMADELPVEVELAKKDGIVFSPPFPPPVHLIPDRQNAAIVYKLLEEKINKIEHEPDSEAAYRISEGKINDGDFDAARRFFKRHSMELSQVEIASKMPYCYFKQTSKEFSENMILGLSFARACARMFSERALLQSHDKDWRGASNSLTTATRVIQQIMSKNHLMGLYSRDACWMIIENSLSKVISMSGDNEQCLESANQLINLMGPTLDAVSVFPEDIVLLYFSMMHGINSPYDPAQENAADLNFINQENFVKAFTAIEIKAKRQIYELLKDTPEDYPKRITMIDESSRKSKNNMTLLDDNYPLTYFLDNNPGTEVFDSATTAEKTTTTLEAKRRLLIMQTELMRYKNKHGFFPKTLNDINKKIPLDPFNDKPLIYKLTDKGFILYSVGRDLQDDGGIDYQDTKDRSKVDIVVRYPAPITKKPAPNIPPEKVLKNPYLPH